MRNVVNALLIREQSVLLAKRSPHRNAYPGLWSFPGGHFEKGETLAEALIRELGEEIGVTPIEYEYLTSIADRNATASDPVVYHMVAVRAWVGEPTLIGDEHTELAWVTLETAIGLPDLALEEYRRLFRDLAKA